MLCGSLVEFLGDLAAAMHRDAPVWSGLTALLMKLLVHFRGVRYVLVCMHVFSRLMYAEAIQTPQTTLPSFRPILADVGAEPKVIDPDLDATFDGLFAFDWNTSRSATDTRARAN